MNLRLISSPAFVQYRRVQCTVLQTLEGRRLYYSKSSDRTAVPFWRGRNPSATTDAVGLGRRIEVTTEISPFRSADFDLSCSIIGDGRCYPNKLFGSWRASVLSRPWCNGIRIIAVCGCCIARLVELWHVGGCVVAVGGWYGRLLVGIWRF